MKALRKYSRKQLISAIIVLILLVVPLVKHWNVFSTQINIDDFAKKYSTSQYVLGEGSPQKISDSELYVYAGYAYLRGEDPTTINFEHPPLAKYFYGLSHYLTGNPYLFNLLLYGGLLWLIYSLLGLVTKKWFLKIIGLGLFGSLSLIQVHLRYALLDVPLLFGYFLFFYGVLVAKNPKPRMLFIGIGLGIAASVKYPFPLIGLLIGYLILESIKTKDLKIPVVSVFVAAIIYFASYTMYFWHGHNLLDWFAFEKYRLSWFMGKTEAPKFLILQTLFFGRFKAWWDANVYESTAHWSIVWPALFNGGIIGFALSILNKHYEVIVLVSFSLLQLLVYGIGAAASDRFFITLLPFWILGTIYMCDMIVEKLYSD